MDIFGVCLVPKFKTPPIEKWVIKMCFWELSDDGRLVRGDHPPKRHLPSGYLTVCELEAMAHVV